MRKMPVQTILVCVFTFLIPFAASAGSLTPPGAPSSGSGMPTMSAIFQQLSSGQMAQTATSFTPPSFGPAASGRNLKDLQQKLPTPDNVHGVKPNEVPQGKTFWGLRTDGAWGSLTGTRIDPYLAPETVQHVSYITSITVPPDGSRPATGGWLVALTGHFTADYPDNQNPDPAAKQVSCENVSLTIGGLSIPCGTIASMSGTSIQVIMPAGTGTVPVSLQILSHPVALLTTTVSASGQIANSTDTAPVISYDRPVITSMDGCVDDVYPYALMCSLQGQRVYIRGRNFGSSPAQISASVDGAPCVPVAVVTGDKVFSCDLPASPAHSATEYMTVTVNGQSSDPFPVGFFSPQLTSGTLRMLPGGVPSNEVSLPSVATYQMEIKGRFLGSAPEVRFGPSGTPFEAMPYSASAITVVTNPTTLDGTLTFTIPPAVGKNVVGIRVGQQTVIGTDALVFPAPVIVPGTIRSSLVGPGSSNIVGASSYGDWVYFDVLNMGSDPSKISIAYGDPGADPSGATFPFICSQFAFELPVDYPTTIKCLTSPGSGAGLSFQVRALNLVSDVGTDTFNYPIAPLVTKLSGCTDVGNTTTNCPTDGGTRITLTGSLFGTLNNTLVYVGSHLVSPITMPDASTIAFTLPPGTGIQPVTVRSGSLQDLAGTVNISYSAPVIGSITGCTDQGITTIGCPASGGIVIKLKGTDFGQAGGAVFVKEQYVGSVSHTVGTPHGEISFILPAGSGWNVPVRFVNNSGIVSNVMSLSYEN